MKPANPGTPTKFPDRELWWWLATPDAESLVFILNTDRTALWVLDFE